MVHTAVMTLEHQPLHRWRASNLAPWTDLELVGGMVEERRKQRVRSFPLADLIRVTLRTRAMVPGGMVILTFRDGGSITCSDWAPVGLGSQRQERGRLLLALGILLEALTPAQRHQVEARVDHSYAAVTLTVGLIVTLVAGSVAVISAVMAPWPEPATEVMGTVGLLATALTVVGVIVIGCAARGWPTQTRQWNPFEEGLPEGWRLNRLEVYDAVMAHLLWGMARPANRAPWPAMMPPKPSDQDPPRPARSIAELLAPGVPTEEVLVLPGTTWRRTADHLDRTTAQGTTSWPLTDLQDLRWCRGFGRRTLTLTIKTTEITITHTPRALATWAAGLRTTLPAATATVEEEPLRRLLAGIVLLVVIVGGLALVILAIIDLGEGRRHRHWEALKILALGLGAMGWAILGPARWLKTSPGRRRWTTGDPESV